MMPCEHGYYGLCPQCVREERDELRSRVVELERERDQLALSLSATRAERDHAVRSAELWESEHRAGYEAMGVYKHLWLEGRAIMAVCGYFSRMRGPEAVAKDAARYQFLRGIAYSGVSPRKELLWCLRGLYDTNGYSFDEAIDAAIAVIAAKAKGK